MPDATTKPLKKRLPNGLRGHHELAAMIVDWCADWISQDEFDKLAYEHRPLGGKMPMTSMGGDDFILSLNQPWLDLLNRLCDCGVVESEKRPDGLIWYRAFPE